MTSFKTVTEDDLNAEVSPEDIEGVDANLEAEHVDEAQNPFAHLLKNLLSGGGRTRRERIIGGDVDRGRSHCGRRQTLQPRFLRIATAMP